MPFLLRQFFDPDVDQPLKTSGSEVGQSGCLPQLQRIHNVVFRTYFAISTTKNPCLELESRSKLLCQPPEFIIVRKCAEDDKDFGPFC